MWDYYRAGMTWINTLNTQQWATALVACAIFGFFCMRGYGSRSNY